jgi:hypothetical protein
VESALVFVGVVLAGILIVELMMGEPLFACCILMSARRMVTHMTGNCLGTRLLGPRKGLQRRPQHITVSVLVLAVHHRILLRTVPSWSR